jgi:glutamate 5-kinase
MQINSKNYQKIVIKIGSSLIVDKNIRLKWLENLVKNIEEIKNKYSCQIVIVTSGAVALGRIALNYQDKKLSIPQKQACAGVGQIKLMSIYQDFFAKKDIKVAQILLTASDCNSRKSYLNLQNTISELLANNIVPIINENDSVAVDEIKIGDNDRLCARVSQMIGADLMILLSDIDGLFDKNPKQHSSAKFISQIYDITKEIEQMAKGTASKVGTGGMITKIMAAKMAKSVNCSTIITSGLENDALKKLTLGKKKFTIFFSEKALQKSSKHLTMAKKNWLSGLVNSKGEIVINKNAVVALKKNASLLAVGVVAIRGNFLQGDAVFIKDEEGNHVANGVVNYGSIEAKKIMQKNSQEIKKIFGQKSKPELIHVDNIVII